MNASDSTVQFTRGETIVWPHGLRTVRIATKEGASFKRYDHAQRLIESASMHRSKEASLSREMVCDSFTDFLAEAISVNGAVAEKAEQSLCGIKAKMKNGSGVVLSSCALRKWELLIQSRRIVSESVEMVALQSGDAESFSDGSSAGQIVTGKDCRLRLQIGEATIATAAFPGETSRAFSAQIIFSRKIEPAQFDRNGIARRHAFGEWDITGQLVCRLSEAEYNQLREQATAALWIECGQGSKINIALPSVIAQTDAQDYFNAKVEHRVSFMAKSKAGKKGLIQVSHAS